MSLLKFIEDFVNKNSFIWHPLKTFSTIKSPPSRKFKVKILAKRIPGPKNGQTNFEENCLPSS
jgi:hypothetical protein